jgi:hypothetical protein
MLLSDGFMSRAILRCAAALACATLILSVPSLLPLHAQTEVRALWVVRTSLTSPAAIETMVSAAKAGGFNTLLVQIRGRGDAYYQRGLEPRARRWPASRHSIRSRWRSRAHDAGPRARLGERQPRRGRRRASVRRDHVVYRHPEWLMVPRWPRTSSASTRAAPNIWVASAIHEDQSSEIEGLYLSPISAPRRYRSASSATSPSGIRSTGIHLDYVRYPNEEFDYSRDSLAAFRQNVLLI